MADTLTTDEFIDFVSQSGLVPPALLDSYQTGRPGTSSGPMAADALARMLVAEKLLTTFQANQLLKRRFRGFFIADKYKILRYLGRGGMGSVLLCEHLILQRLVAVKLMNAALDAAPGAAERFVREARAAASLDHPNIARVFDVDRAEQGPYIVMEYVDGVNLHELVADHGQLSIARAAHYIRQAAAGLGHAHERGLVHRDIKPANLMLDRSGTIKLLDLGLARFFDTGKNGNVTQHSDQKGVLGTTDFIAPEQAMDSATADIRADIYSLGCTFYFLLLRRLTVGNGSMIQKLLNHQSREPESIRSLRPEVPEGLAAVVEKMYRKNPADRYQTPAELIEALAPWTNEPLDKPSADEMPKVTPSTFRLGLCGPPSSGPGSGSGIRAAMPTSSVRSAQVSMGTNADSDPPVRSKKSGGSSLAGLLEEEFPDLNDASLPPLPGSVPTSGGRTGRPSPLDPLGPSLDGVAPSPPQRSGVRKRVAPAASETQRATATLAIAVTAEPSGNSRQVWILLAGVLVAVLALAAVGLTSMAMFGGNEPPSAASVPGQTGPARDARAPISPAAAQPTAAPTGLVLLGGGSALAKPVMERWGEMYLKQTGVAIDYTPVDTAKAIDGTAAKFLDLACLDAPLSDEQLALAPGPLLHVPLMLRAVVPIYHLPGRPVQLRFTGVLLANIYLGKITRWNDELIAAHNPGVRLPDLDITVVYPVEASETTAIWSSYLSAVSPTWRDEVGAAAKLNWPVGTPCDRADQVDDTLSRVPGAIGFVDWGTAGKGLPIGAVQNKTGIFVSVSGDRLKAAAAGAIRDMPDDLRYTLIDVPGKASYPIVGTIWAVVCQQQPATKKSEVLKFLRWATTDGQQTLSDMNHGRLPPELATRAQQVLEHIE